MEFEKTTLPEKVYLFQERQVLTCCKWSAIPQPRSSSWAQNSILSLQELLVWGCGKSTGAQLKQKRLSSPTLESCFTYQEPAGGKVAAVRAENPSWLPEKLFFCEVGWSPFMGDVHILSNGGPCCQALASFGGSTLVLPGLFSITTHLCVIQLYNATISMQQHIVIEISSPQRIFVLRIKP